ncbi:MAG: hypothetical protein KKE17_11995 [Proteobacteria bacterium]|nr:hypothetical protein [Pseudomonadota bacterium]MBU1710718.1 hypothetical protein [Pseudomonadota bacterium]
MKFLKVRCLLIVSMAVLFVTLAPPSSCLAIGNEECMECHSDDSLSRVESEGMKVELYINQARFEVSVHNANDVACVDCHSDIEELNFDNEVPHAVSLAVVNCDKCHEAEAEAYIDSVHKKAGGKGITIPCYACHGYHYVSHLESESVLERENGFCLKCHNPNKFHEWLPQMDTHFAFVECTVCHAPEVPRYVNIRFQDLKTNKFLSGEEFLAVLGTDSDGFMALVDEDKNEIIDVNEFEDLVFLLLEKDVRGTFHGEIVVAIEPIVHHVNRGVANRACEMCHMPTSPFFENVRFSLSREDGTSQNYVVERKVLETYYMNHFYALGGTRIRLLDQIGLALVVGGAGIIIAHLTLRILTIPARKQRKQKSPFEQEQDGGEK